MQLSANTYYRKSKRKTLNGDINDDFNEDAEIAAGGICLVGGFYDDDGDPLTPLVEADEEVTCSGALNRSNTDQKGYGFNAQLAFNQPVLCLLYTSRCV